MTSRFQRERDERIDLALAELIPAITGFTVGQHNYQIAMKFAASNIRYHSYPETDRHIVQQKLEGVLQALSILCNPDCSAAMQNLWNRFLKKPLNLDYPDPHYRVLDLLIGLRGNLVEANQGRQFNPVPNAPQVVPVDPKIQQDDDWEQHKIYLEWGKFETSSEEEEQEDPIVEEQQVVIEVNTNKTGPQCEAPQQTGLKPNFLYHLSNPARRSYTKFLQQGNQSKALNQFEMFLPENQRFAAQNHVTRQQHLYQMKSFQMLTEVDLITSIMYAFLDQESMPIRRVKVSDNNNCQSQILKTLQTIDGYCFVLHDDVCVEHLSIEALQYCLTSWLDSINTIALIKQLVDQNRHSTYVNKLERESQIKEAFWNAVHKQHSQFVDQVIQLMRAILEKQDPQFEFNGRTDPAITFIYVESKLTNHIRQLQETLVIALQIQQQHKKDSIFSSPTLCILFDACRQETSGSQLRTKLEMFLYAMQPYCAMLDAFLDYHNIKSALNWSGENIPGFLVNVLAQLKAIGHGYQIFTQMQSETPSNDDFLKVSLTEVLLERLQQSFKIHLEPQTIQIKETIEISFQSPLKTTDSSSNRIQEEFDYGPYEMNRNEGKFINFQKAPIETPTKVTTITRPVTLFNLIDHLDHEQMLSLPRILTTHFHEIVSQQYELIQQRMIHILFDRLALVDVLKFLRTLYFFERIDVMSMVVEKVAEGSQGIGRLRAFQAQLKESLIEHRVAPKPLVDRVHFQVDSSQHKQGDTIHFLNPRNFQMQIALQHPLDLIVDDNSLLLYNKIMQFLIFFKNSKHNLQSAHQVLKKRISAVQNHKQGREHLDNDVESPKFQMQDERDYELKQKYLRTTHQLWVQMCHFSQEMTNFMNSYEYFLFVSVINQQTNAFLEVLTQKKDFQSIVDLHLTYLKSIADKIFLNKKTEQILETVNVLLNSAQNLPLLVNRVSSLEIVDNSTIRLETERVGHELMKQKESYVRSLQILLTLFDNTERKIFAPEIIEAIYKSNFNKYYQQ